MARLCGKRTRGRASSCPWRVGVRPIVPSKQGPWRRNAASSEPASVAFPHVCDKGTDSAPGVCRRARLGQFHSPANLAKSIVIEAGELLEQFQWTDEFDNDAVKAELADVLTYAYLLADRLKLSPDEIVLEKLETTRAKYPVDRSRGRSERYDQLPD